MVSGRVEALWLKPEEYGPMKPVGELRVVRGTGIEHNADWGGKRQITILEKERWDTMVADLGHPDLDPSARRANVLVSGCDLADSKHRILHLGGVRIEIMGETRPCERMDQAQEGLRRAMAAPWNGGAYGIILDDGVIRVGNAVELEGRPRGSRAGPLSPDHYLRTPLSPDQVLVFSIESAPRPERACVEENPTHCTHSAV